VISTEYFLRCKSLSWAEFEIGSGLSELEAEAFRESGLTSIHLPASVTVIGDICFGGCSSLTSITFESGSQLSELPNRAFCESGLISIHLPASVTVIGEYCFSGYRKLVSITFESGSTFRGSEADLLAGVPLGETDSGDGSALFDDSA
jgi:hypothetical protein